MQPTPIPVGQALPIWLHGAPEALGDAPVDIPTIEAFMPEPAVASGAAMLVLPGGGYQQLSDHESAPVGQWLARNGIAAFVLRYRLAPRYHYPAALRDAQRAMRLLRYNAASWGFDPERIGVLGFSAGGHLAASVATYPAEGDGQAVDGVERMSARPRLQVLIYPVIVARPLDAVARYSLIGEGSLFAGEPSPALLDEMSVDLRVTAQTPPAFLVHSTADDVVLVENADRYAAALAAHNTPCEYVRGALGPHGFGLQPFWTEACIKWLRTQGF